MTPDAPRPLESKEETPATHGAGSASTKAGAVVLLLAAVAAVIVMSFSTQSSAPGDRSVADSVAPRAAVALPDGGKPAADLVQASIPSRVHAPSPFDSATTDSAVAGCTAIIRETLADGVEVSVDTSFGDVDPTKGRTDSLIIEGRAGTRLWHCSAVKRGDGAVARIDTVTEEPWGPGAYSGFVGAHAVTVAAEQSCLARVNKLFPGFVFRGVQIERRGNVLHVSGDAFPIENDLVRPFSCDATVHNGQVVDVQARRDR